MADPTAPIGFALDKDGDLYFGPAGITTVSGLEAVTQAVRYTCLLFKGEWFLDLEVGVPYFEDILGQKFNQNRVQDAFRREILKVPHVLEVINMTTEYDSQMRVLDLSFEVTTEFGALQLSQEIQT